LKKVYAILTEKTQLEIIFASPHH